MCIWHFVLMFLIKYVTLQYVVTFDFVYFKMIAYILGCHGNSWWMGLIIFGVFVFFYVHIGFFNKNNRQGDADFSLREWLNPLHHPSRKGTGVRARQVNLLNPFAWFVVFSSSVNCMPTLLFTPYYYCCCFTKI